MKKRIQNHIARRRFVMQKQLLQSIAKPNKDKMPKKYPAISGKSDSPDEGGLTSLQIPKKIKTGYTNAY